MKTLRLLSATIKDNLPIQKLIVTMASLENETKQPALQDSYIKTLFGVAN